MARRVLGEEEEERWIEPAEKDGCAAVCLLKREHCVGAGTPL